MKRTLTIFTTLICILALLAACDGDALTSKEPVIITELNQAYEDNTIRVTITELKATERQREDDDRITVSTMFLVENLSEHEIYISRHRMKAYADDFAVDAGNTAANIAPNKKAEISSSSIIPKDTKCIELYFEHPYKNTLVAIFAFDVPPVES